MGLLLFGMYSCDRYQLNMKKDTELVEPFSMPNAEDFQNDFDFPNATLLGSGSFGKVYKAAWKRTGEFKAVKIVESIKYCVPL